MIPVMKGQEQVRHAVQTPRAEAAIRAFRASLRGDLLAPGDSGYDGARRVYNAMIDRRPALIVRPADAGDIRRAVLFAREQDWPLSIKGGGHSVSGSAVCEGGVMLDLSVLKGVRVDPERQIAVAQPGLLLADLDRATQAAGLATPLGVISATGIAGLTLGGGIGWLNGKHGLACDNLLAADVVTAAGELLRASADENGDLFWAIRGGSGNFGVVTSLVYQLHPVGPILGGSVDFPAAQAREALRFYYEFASAAPDELTTIARFGFDSGGRTTVAVDVCWCGSLEDGARALRSLRAFGPPEEDTIGTMDYCDLQSAADERYPPGQQHYWKAAWLADLNDGAIEVMLRFAAKRPVGATSHVTIALQQMHGGAARVDPAATAFPHRRDQYDFLILSQWSDPADAARHIEWTRRFFDAMQPFTERAVYVNNLGAEEKDRVREAYGANYERLAAIKTTYDPDNLFRSNQNIRPATEAAITPA
jgi:FAD/FMN-containing dehydrogenase